MTKSGLSIATVFTTGTSIQQAGGILTFDQIGGNGIIYNTVLAVPSHLNCTSPVQEDNPWNSVEYVCITPGAAVGEHVQGTDEIYFLHRGVGTLTTNGDAAEVAAGTLVIAPKGTRHTIRNTSASDNLTFLVIELHTTSSEAQREPETIAVLPTVEAHDFHEQGAGTSERLHVAQLDLSAFFSGPFGMLSVIELPPETQLEEYVLDEQDENLFILDGSATIRLSSNVQLEPISDGGHRNIVIPAGMSRCILNSSHKETLRVLSVRVHRQVHRLSRSSPTFASASLA